MTYIVTPDKNIRHLSPEEVRECKRLAKLSLVVLSGGEKGSTKREKEANLILDTIRLAEEYKDQELAKEREQLGTQKKQLQSIAENITKDLTPADKQETTKKIPPNQTRPLSMKKWEKILGANRKTLRKIYNFHRVSERKWTLTLDEFPAEYLEKYQKT